VAVLLLLTAVAGALDAITFLHLGGTFVSNQTGTIVLLTMAVAGQADGDPAVAVTSLVFFFVGAAVAARSIPAATRQQPWPRGTAWVLISEVTLIILTTLLRSLDRFGDQASVAPIALAMGMQAALAVRVGLRFLTTGYVTGSTVGSVMSSPAGDRSAAWWWYGLIPVAVLAAGAFGASLLAQATVAGALLASAGLAAFATALVVGRGSTTHVDRAPPRPDPGDQ
jgi:uncharacterized membrane protein YoaK (UPF0700 family)